MSLPRNFSKAIAELTARSAGLDKNKADFASAPDQAIVTAFLTKFTKARDLNARQELAKAALHEITQELDATMKDMNDSDAKTVALIHSKYSKKSDKLEEFGLKAWKHGKRKAPKPKA
jgi:hypothetical protein